ncbi:MAG: flavodoxin family protein [Lachnospiraceae bacterium]|nr:flavodoxin family protein [Lachnospiraceae bacterium]
MKITVLNGSPRANGNTGTMVQALEKGATEAGHEVTVLHIGAKKVAGCLGCQYCFGHEGICVQKDDMTGIWEVLNQTDLLVFATPIYWWEVTAQTKAVIDRLYAHALVGFNFNKVALLFDSGSDGVYDAPISMFKSICEYLKWENIGTICVPNMENKDSMKTVPQLAEVYEFGRQIQE